MTPWFDDSFVVSQLVDDLSYHADLTGEQPGNEPAFMPAYEAARSRVGTQSAGLTSWSANMTRPVQG